MTAPHDPRRQGKANLRMGLLLASVALAFFAGFLVKMMYFGR
ncbi:MAG: cytochrome oxidase small assembly protein [Aquabacterium sp.]|nr:cytochrome oxidase small assembly protein [Aquabacterium sp.]